MHGYLGVALGRAPQLFPLTRGCSCPSKVHLKAPPVLIRGNREQGDTDTGQRTPPPHKMWMLLSSMPQCSGYPTAEEPEAAGDIPAKSGHHFKVPESPILLR